jgi:hypothetical protein
LNGVPWPPVSQFPNRENDPRTQRQWIGPEIRKHTTVTEAFIWIIAPAAEIDSPSDARREFVEDTHMSISIKKLASSALPLYLLAFTEIMPGVGYCASSGAGSVAGIQDAMEQKQRQLAMSALQNLQNMSANQHSQAADEARKVVNAMDHRIGALEGQVGDACESDGLTVSEEERRDDMLREIRIKRMALEKWYGGIEYGGGNQWKKIKQGFANAYFDLNNYFGEAVLAFNMDGGR